jgi:hypothetical protein
LEHPLIFETNFLCIKLLDLIRIPAIAKKNATAKAREIAAVGCTLQQGRRSRV